MVTTYLNMDSRSFIKIISILITAEFARKVRLEKTDISVSFTIENEYASLGDTVLFECVCDFSGTGHSVFDIYYKIKGTDQYVQCSQNCIYFPVTHCIGFQDRLLDCEKNKTMFSVKLTELEELDFSDYRCQASIITGPDNVQDDSDSASLVEYVQTYINWTPGTSFQHNESDSFSISCQASNGQPSVTVISWFIEDSKQDEDNIYFNEETQTSTLQLVANRTLHEKNVICEAHQMEGKANVSTEPKQFEIAYPPKSATANHTHVNGTVGYTVVLECFVSDSDIGNPNDYNYFWTRASDGSFKMNTTSGKLEFVPEDECSQDVYYCSPANVGGYGQHADIELSLIVPPTSYLPSEYKRFVEDELLLECSCTGIPTPILQWDIPEDKLFLFKPGPTEVIDIGECGLKQTSSNLKWSEDLSLEQRKGANEVTISCICQNSYPTVHVSSTVLNITYPPGKASVETDTDEINVGEQMCLTCSLATKEYGNPHYYKYNFYSTDGSDSGWKTDKEFCITISSIDKRYYCKAQNKPTDEEWKDGEESDFATFEIYVIPEFIFPINQITYKPRYDNTSFTMECDAIGLPNVTIEIIKNGMPINSDFEQTTQLFKLTEDKYGLSDGIKANFTWNVANIGRQCETITHYDSSTYQCMASNKGTEQHNVESELFVIQTKYYPLWNGSSFDVYAEYNQSEVKLNCDVCAYPPANYSWRKNGSQIENEDNQVLILTSIGEDDFTSYTCVATNEIGTNNFTLMLQPDSAPLMVTRGIIDITSISLTVSWDSYHGGNPPVNFSVFYKQTNDDESYVLWSNNIISYVDGETLHDDILNLNYYTTYDIKVVAVNTREDDNSDAMEVKGTTTYAQPQIELTSAELKDKQLTVEWLYQTTFLHDLSYHVTVRIAYWKGDPINEILYPTEENPALNATDQYVTFSDSRLNSEYVVELVVYENGFRNYAIDSNPTDPDIIKTGLSAGGIVGISIFVMLLVAIPIVAFFIYTGKITIPYRKENSSAEEPVIRRDENELEFINLSYGHEAGPVYTEVIKSKKTSKDSHSKESEPAALYENFDFRQRPPIAPKPIIKPKPSDLPSTRFMDAEGCIYMRLDGLEFPNYKPPKKGKKPVIHGIENLTVYATIDYNARAPTPPPEYAEEEEEEEDVMDHLPDRK